jgi:protein-tyrosine phosphatase
MLSQRKAERPSWQLEAPGSSGDAPTDVAIPISQGLTPHHLTLRISIMVHVLFVCLGNICRSPMAEGLFIHLVKEAGLSDKVQIDSAGTGNWHVGARADTRMRETAAKHGIELPSRARQVTLADFDRFDYILPMDQSNLSDLRELQLRAPQARAQVIKMRHFDPEAPEADVPDPYYDGQRGFEEVYDMLNRACAKLLAHIVAAHDLQPQSNP